MSISLPNNSKRKARSLLVASLVASMLMTACGGDSQSSSFDKANGEQTDTPNNQDTLTEAQIQAKQKNQVAAFSAIKMLQDGLGDDTANNIFASNLSDLVPQNAQSDLAAWLEGAYASKDSIAGQSVAGKLARTPKDGEDRSIIVSGAALEYAQLVKKGLIGAYQLNGALGEAAKAKSATAGNAEILANVTAYLLGDYAQLAEGKGEDYYPGNEFEKYLKRVAGNENFSSLEDDLYTALNAAKANLNNNEKFTASIMTAIGVAQKAVAIRAVHYLNEGAKLEDTDESGTFGNVAHGVSEGLGLLYSLQHTYNPQTQQPYYTEAQIDEFIASIDLWNKTDAKTKLVNMAADIASKFGFDGSKA